MPIQATFTGEIGKITCVSCPVRALQESQFIDGVEPGITPCEAAAAVLGALQCVRRSIQPQPAESEQGGEVISPNMRQVVGNFAISEAVELLEETAFITPKERGAHGTAVLTVRMCLSRIRNDNCRSE